MDVAIDPEELEGLDDGAVRQLYEQRVAEEQAKRPREVCLQLHKNFPLKILV